MNMKGPENLWWSLNAEYEKDRSLPHNITVSTARWHGLGGHRQPGGWAGSLESRHHSKRPGMAHVRQG